MNFPLPPPIRFLAWLVLLISPLAAPCATPPPDPICGTWRWFDKHVRTFQPDGTVMGSDGKLHARWVCATPRALVNGGRIYVITFTSGKFVDTLTLKNNGALLDGFNNTRFHVTATRMAGVGTVPSPGMVTPPGAMVVPQPMMPGRAAPPVARQSGLDIGPPLDKPEERFGGMALAPVWMPQKLDTRRELLLGLEFYSQKAVGKAQPGKETVPATLYGPISWLMPLEEAVKTLPERAVRTVEQRITETCFPQGSLTWVAYQYKSFSDRNQAFNLLFFILDAKRRVVGLQLRDQAANAVLWEPRPDGVREPYFNFVSLSHNGSSENEVQYQVRNAGPGVTLIKTALYDRGKLRYLENIHWYLAAPFARSLLDIVEKNRKAGMLR